MADGRSESTAGSAAPETTSGVSGKQIQDLSRRLALLTFTVYLTLVAGFLLFGPPPSQHWFSGDDWNFLTTEAGPTSLFHEHFGHWVAIPFLLYRTLFTIFGITTYLPYLALTVAAHLTVVVLIRVVMRRAGVGPWVATITASALALFAAGADNFIYAFQVTLVGSMALGLGQLLLADHDGPLERGDWLAVLLGLLSLMFSGVGLMMLVVVGLATLVRRGPGPAAFHFVPLLIVYLAWRMVFSQPDTIPDPDLAGAPAWAAAQFSAAGTGLFGPPLIAGAVAIACAAGLYLSWRGLEREQFRRVAASPLALGAGAVALSALTWWSRGFIPQFAVMDKYTYLQAAALLPLVGIGISGLVGHSRLAWVLLIPLILITPLRLGELTEVTPRVLKEAELRQTLPAIAHSRWARLVPPDTPADPEGFFLENPVTVGWLLDSVAAGRIPDPDPGGKVTDSRIRLIIGVVDAPAAPGGRQVCRSISATDPAVITTGAGDVFRITAEGLDWGARTGLDMKLLDKSGRPVALRRIRVDSELDLMTQLPGLTLQFSPTDNLAPGIKLEVCSSGRDRSTE